MAENVEKDLFADNIHYLIKKSGLSVKRFEEEIGVPKGYLSKISKKSEPVSDDDPIEEVDFLMRCVDFFNLSVFILLAFDFSASTPTERYLVSFLDKLISDTGFGGLCWVVRPKDAYDEMGIDLQASGKNLTFHLKPSSQKDKGNHPELAFKYIYNDSKFYNDQKTISGDCYYLDLRNSSALHLINVRYGFDLATEEDVFAKEIWMQTKSGLKLVCSDLESPRLAKFIKTLFNKVGEYVKQVEIDKEVEDAIDLYMESTFVIFKDDFDLPF